MSQPNRTPQKAENTVNGSEHRKRVIMMTIAAFFSFFILSFFDNIKGPVVPGLIAELDLSYSRIGTVFLTAGIGYLVTTLTSGFLVEVIGRKNLLFFAGFACAAGMFLFSIAHSFLMLMVGMAIGGLGFGCIQIGGNTTVIDIHPHDRGRFLNLLTFFHGFSGMIAPYYAGKLIAAGISWRQVYQIPIILALLLSVYLLFTKYPNVKGKREEEQPLNETAGPRSINSGKPKNGLFSREAFSLLIILHYLLMGSYVFGEIGIATWMVEYLHKVKDIDLVTGSLYLSLFFGLLTTGRFIGSFFVERIGYYRMIILAACCAFVVFLTGYCGPRSLAFFIPVTGLFFSVIFPTNVASVTARLGGKAGSVLGILFTFAGFGGMLGSWLVGVASEYLGIKLGFLTVGLFCMANILLIIAISIAARVKRVPKD